MFNSSSIKQSTIINGGIPFCEKYPSIVIEVNKFDIIDIAYDSNISFLKNESKQVLINGNIKFVIHKDLIGIIQLGKFRIWYSRPDNFDRYVKLIMLEAVN